MYNFDDLKPTDTPCPVRRPPASVGFIASYPTVAKPGTHEGLFVNTQFLQPDRKSELAGGVAVRAQHAPAM